MAFAPVDGTFGDLRGAGVVGKVTDALGTVRLIFKF